MRTANPFNIGIGTDALIGRKHEIEIFNSYINSELGQHIAVIGSKGIGKTALLKKFRQIADKNKLSTVTIYLNKKTDDSEIARKTKGIDSVFLEDLDKDEKIVESVEKIKSRIVVVSSISDKKISKENFIIMKLKPLNEIEIKEFIEEKLKDKEIKVASGCLELIVEETEGHPFVLLLVLWNLYDKLKESEKIATRGHYLNCFSSTIELLSYNFFDDLYNELSDGEKAVLKAVVKSKEGTPREIADICGKPLNTVTTLLLRLVESGNLIKISRGKYRIFNRLYGKYVEII